MAYAILCLQEWKPFRRICRIKPVMCAMTGGIMVKRIAKAILIVVAVALLALVAFIVVIAATDYRPCDIEPVEVENRREWVTESGAELSVTTFNIGYCGLDKHTDFFMDKGTMSRSISREQTEINVDKVSQFLQEADSDFYLVQEVDRKGKRSYNIDQYKRFIRDLPEYSSSFATNYKVAWVPIPVTHQYGNIYSGIATYSTRRVDSAERLSLPGQYPWLKQLFMLDRCLLESRLPVDNGKELVLVNLHLSAYDQGGTIRAQQLAFVKEYAVREWGKGNYVILGGDWNHLLSATPKEKKASYGDAWPDWLQLLPDDFVLEGFEWAMDEEVASNRCVDRPYNPATTVVQTIDGFLVSPNVEIVAVQGIDLGFENSDHNPVTAVFKLK